MSQKLPINRFMWYDDYLSDFNEEFIKVTMKIVPKNIMGIS